ncbi:MAG: hypothetical protein HZB42_11290 [Sphingobacteriales bacterium]|nr:hypothetical protein [Sphingobacteriales bacterium]
MRNIFLSSSFILFAIIVRTQPTPPKPPTVEERLKRTSELIQKEVQLTTAQQSAIEQAYKSFFTAADKLRKDNPPPPPPPPDPKVKEAMDKLVKERDESIKKILTEDQYKKYKEAAKKLQPPKPGGPDNRPGQPPPPQQ